MMFTQQKPSLKLCLVKSNVQYLHCLNNSNQSFFVMVRQQLEHFLTLHLPAPLDTLIAEVAFERSQK